MYLSPIQFQTPSNGGKVWQRIVKKDPSTQLDIGSSSSKPRPIISPWRRIFYLVPDYWDEGLEGKVNKVNLNKEIKEYKEVERAFRKTAPNKIVRIERVQNAEIYELYNVKRQAMMKKYGTNFPGKELMLFHGTSAENIEKINSGGLNRSFAGIHGKMLIYALVVVF
jgi:hypothetical protein